MILLPGLVGISLARNPDGLVSEVRIGARALHRIITERRATARAAPASRAGSTRIVPELVGLGGPVTMGELVALDRGLGVTAEDCRGTA